MVTKWKSADLRNGWNAKQRACVFAVEVLDDICHNGVTKCFRQSAFASIEDIVRVESCGKVRLREFVGAPLARDAAFVSVIRVATLGFEPAVTARSPGC